MAASTQSRRPTDHDEVTTMPGRSPSLDAATCDRRRPTPASCEVSPPSPRARSARPAARRRRGGGGHRSPSRWCSSRLLIQPSPWWQAGEVRLHRRTVALKPSGRRRLPRRPVRWRAAEDERRRRTGRASDDPEGARGRTASDDADDGDHRSEPLSTSPLDGPRKKSSSAMGAADHDDEHEQDPPDRRRLRPAQVAGPLSPTSSPRSRLQQQETAGRAANWLATPMKKQDAPRWRRGVEGPIQCPGGRAHRARRRSPATSAPRTERSGRAG